jgi:hypothetical protein
MAIRQKHLLCLLGCCVLTGSLLSTVGPGCGRVAVGPPRKSPSTIEAGSSFPSTAAQKQATPPIEDSARIQLTDLAKTLAVAQEESQVNSKDSWAAKWRGKSSVDCLADYWSVSTSELKDEFVEWFGEAPSARNLLVQPVGEGVLDWELAKSELLDRLRDQILRSAGTIDNALHTQGLQALNGIANECVLALEIRNPGTTTPSYIEFRDRFISNAPSLLDLHADYLTPLLALLDHKVSAELYDKFPLLTLPSKRKHSLPNKNCSHLMTLNASGHGWIVQLCLWKGESAVVDNIHASIGDEVRYCLAATIASFGYALPPAEVESLLRGQWDRKKTY